MGLWDELLSSAGSIITYTEMAGGTVTLPSGSTLGSVQSYWPYTVVNPMWEPIITFESLAPIAVTHNPSKTVLFIWEP